MLIALVAFTSCEKDDPIDPTNPDGGHITLAQLNGTWEFQKYVYDGVDYTADNALSGMSGIFFTHTINVLDMIYYDGGISTYRFTKDVNEIIVFKSDGGERFRFTVVGYNKNNNEISLRVDYTVFGYGYLGGTLVLKKQ